MNKESKTNKRLLIAGLFALCLCLAVALFVHLGNMGGEAADPQITDPPPDSELVSVAEIEPATEPTTEPDLAPEPVEVPPVTTPQAEESQPTDRPKTPEEATPPEPPVVEDETEVTNPAQPPAYTPEQTQPSAQPSSTQGGDTNSSGQASVPGLGWVTSPDEPNTQGTAPNAGTGDPVGDM